MRGKALRAAAEWDFEIGQLIDFLDSSGEYFSSKPSMIGPCQHFKMLSDERIQRGGVTGVGLARLSLGITYDLELASG